MKRKPLTFLDNRWECVLRNINNVETLICKQYKQVAIYSLVHFYFTLWLLLYIFEPSGVSGEVRHNDYFDGTCKRMKLTDLRYVVSALGSGATACSLLVISIRFCTYTFKFKGVYKYVRPAYIGATCLMFISMTCEVLTVSGMTKLACDDIFGVRAPTIQCLEWLVTVPLMYYLNLSMDTEKKRLKPVDYVIIASGYVNILAYSLMSVIADQTIAYTLLMISFAACSLGTYLNVSQAYEQYNAAKLHEMTEMHDFMRYTVSTNRLGSAKVFAIICFSFPVPYFLCMLGMIDNRIALSMFAFLNMLTKTFFILFLLEGHLDVLDPASLYYAAERRSSRHHRELNKFAFDEIRSSLNSISLGSQMLLDTSPSLGADELEISQMMRNSSVYMNEVLEDVQRMQRIEEGLIKMDYRKVEVADMIKCIKYKHGSIVTDSGMHLQIDVTESVPEIVTLDAAKVLVVIHSFFLYSLKFCKPHSLINLVIDFEDGPEGPHILFSVFDDSDIIEEDQIEHLFEPYVNDGPKNIVGRGTGIGLAVCKEIIHLHGGEIGYRPVPAIHWRNDLIQKYPCRVTSQGEKFSGCEFYFTVPTVETSGELQVNNLVPPQMVWEELLRKHEDEQAAESSRRRNFMVVDGNPMIRRFVQVLADRRGYNCDQAASGSQCLQLSTLKEYSMIIIDYKMNGLYATMELKRKGYSGLIIGLIDPHQGSGSVQQFMDAGADSVIVTPFTARQLDKLISFMNELRSPSFSGRLQGDQGPLKEFEKAPNLLGGTSRSSDSPPKRSPHIVGEDTGGDDPSPQLLKKKPIKMSISTDETDAATTGLRQRVKSEMTNKSDT